MNADTNKTLTVIAWLLFAILCVMVPALGAVAGAIFILHILFKPKSAETEAADAEVRKILESVKRPSLGSEIKRGVMGSLLGTTRSGS